MFFGLYCFMFLPSSVFIDLFGSRKIAVFGACLSTIGLLLSCLVRYLSYYLLTYSIFFGIGNALLLQSTLQILPHYFSKRIGFATGLMNSCGSVFTLGILIITAKSFQSVGLHNTFLILAALSSITIIAASTFKSVLQPNSNINDKLSTRIKESFAISILKKRELIIWIVSSCLSLLGFAITNVTIVSYLIVMNSVKGLMISWFFRFFS